MSLEEKQIHIAIASTTSKPGAVVNNLQLIAALAAQAGRDGVDLCGYDGRQHHHIGHGMIVTPMGEVPAWVHGLPNLDRQRPMYAHAVVDMADRLS